MAPQEDATAVALDAPHPSAELLSKLNAGHQEIDRIMDEVESIYHSQPTEWLALEPIGSMICHLWYEDMDDFEDAVGGSFEEFLRVLPHIEVKKNEKGASVFKVLKPDPNALPCTLTLHVKTRADLWRVFFKAPDASVRIPHLEFEIGCTHKRHIDTVYNHITNAVWNLSSHIRGRTDLDSAYVEGVTETIDQLNALLDIETPFDVVVDDPTGFSIFKPDEDVEKVIRPDEKLRAGISESLLAEAEDAD
uniref:ZPR1 jelly-roll domain-containing protein n=1 Tax=Chrysotila carterae TaxID=13221 RepID=A0A7S4B839_CHRCT